MEIVTFDETIENINILVLSNGEQVDIQSDIKMYMDGERTNYFLFRNYENFN